MHVALGSDHAGYTLRGVIHTFVAELGHQVQDIGTFDPAPVDYPKFGADVGRLVARGAAQFGILVCGTGIGVSLAANCIPGVRAVVCTEAFSVALARAHNDCNILCFGERVIGQGVAKELVRTFLTTPFEGGRHLPRVVMLQQLRAKPDSLSEG